MTKLLTRMTTVILALILALPTIGCQKKEEKEKVLDVQIQGKTRVKVERSKGPDGKDGRLEVEVERHPEHEPGDRSR